MRYEPGIASVIEPYRIADAIAIIKQVYLDAFPVGDGGTRAEVRRLAMSSKRDHSVKDVAVFENAWGKMCAGEAPMLCRVTGTQRYRYLHEHERSERLQAETVNA